MVSQSHAIQTLRNTGCRLTPQRLLILSVIAEGAGHLGVDEVFRRAQRSYPYLDLATVYRTLHLFKQVGVVTKVGIGDRLHFELTDPNGRHHHMVCRLCSGAFDLSTHHLDGFREALAQQYGFEPDLDHFTITGVCASCAQRQDEKIQEPSSQRLLSTGSSEGSSRRGSGI